MSFESFITIFMPVKAWLPVFSADLCKFLGTLCEWKESEFVSMVICSVCRGSYNGINP